MSEIETKRIRSAAVEVKGGEHGLFRSIIAHTNRVDFGRDVLLPGATKSCLVSMSSYNHSGEYGHLPPGKGRVYEQGSHIKWDGEFFDTFNGQEYRKTIIGLGPLAEYSVEYKVSNVAPMTDEWRSKGAGRLIESWEIYAVAPVMKGMMPDTRTVEVKCDGCCGAGAQKTSSDPFSKEARQFFASIAHLTDPNPGSAKASLARRLLRFAWSRTSPGGICPKLRWCMADGKKLGMFDHERNEIWLNTTLEGDELALTTFHELRHATQWKSGQRYNEVDAEAWAVRTLTRWKSAD